MNTKHPQHDRALELFRQGHDISQAWLLACDEARDRARQLGQHLDADERPAYTWSPANGRMVGVERNG